MGMVVQLDVESTAWAVLGPHKYFSQITVTFPSIGLDPHSKVSFIFFIFFFFCPNEGYIEDTTSVVMGKLLVYDMVGAG